MTVSYTIYQITNMVKCVKATIIDGDGELCKSCSNETLCKGFYEIYKAGLDAGRKEGGIHSNF